MSSMGKKERKVSPAKDSAHVGRGYQASRGTDPCGVCFKKNRQARPGGLRKAGEETGP